MAQAPPPLDAEELARSALVRDRVAAAADSSGFVPFDRFMEIALYGRDVGFYARARSPLGTEGEFYTAAHVTPLFARTIAERLRATRRALGNPSPFRIVELGPGDGRLAREVVSALADEPPGIEYVLVDRAAARADESERRTRSEGGTIPTRRSASLADVGPFTGAVLANEFLDAQPARRLRRQAGTWREVGVRVTGSGLEWADSEMVRAVPGDPAPSAEGPELTMEFSPAAEGAVREIADHLDAGVAILIDFGLTEPELFRAHPTGTLAAVRGHRFLADPLAAPGTADLSTFVDFTRIRGSAQRSGLVELAFRSQAEALGAWGFPALRDGAVAATTSPEEKVRLQMAVKNLLFGFERFHALELAPPGSAATLGGLR